MCNSKWPTRQVPKIVEAAKRTQNTPTWNVNIRHPITQKVREPGIVPSDSKKIKVLQRDALESRYHLFVDFEEDPKTSMR